MSNIATTISQSRKLIELGLVPNSADMVWTTANPDLPMLLAYPIEDCNSWNDKVPAWSLSALLEVIPKDTNETYHLFSSMMADQLGSWVCDRSKYYMGADGHNKNDYECFKSNSPVTAAYEMVCWLLEQGLIKKGRQQ